MDKKFIALVFPYALVAAVLLFFIAKLGKRKNHIVNTQSVQPQQGQLLKLPVMALPSLNVAGAPSINLPSFNISAFDGSGSAYATVNPTSTNFTYPSFSDMLNNQPAGNTIFNIVNNPPSSTQTTNTNQAPCGGCAPNN